MKNLENPRLVLLWNTDSVVRNGVDHPAILHPTTDADSTRPGRVDIFQRIIEKVRKHLIDLGRIAKAGGKSFNFKRGAILLKLKIHRLFNFTQHAGHIQALNSEGGAAKA